MISTPGIAMSRYTFDLRRHKDEYTPASISPRELQSRYPDSDRREVVLVAVKPANKEIHDLRQLIANLHPVAPTFGKEGIWTVSCVEDRIACAEQGSMHMIYLAGRIANRYDNKIGC
jgi:hypothetical protein